jgi:hypothetical protein
MFTHKVGITYTNDAGSISNTTDTYLVDGEVNLDEVVAAGQVNKEYDISITQANIKSMVLIASQALTLKTNSTSSPQETIALAANKQLVWTIDHIEAKPFAGNITKFYVTNAGGTDATLKFRCGLGVAV